MKSTDLSVCLLNDSFVPQIDGVVNAVVNYAERITETGGKAMVVTPEYPGADDSAFPYPVLRYPGLDLREAVGYMAGYPFSPSAAKAVKNARSDIIHSHCPVASTIFARSIRGLIDSPLIMTYHTKFDIDIANALKGKLIQDGAIMAMVSNISACDEIWAVSDGAGRNLQSLGYEGDYIVMPNGVDIPKGRLPEDEVRKLTEGCGLPEGVPVYLFVGRLMWYKGIRIILDALAALKYKGLDFRMIFIGSGQDADAIKAYSSKLKLDGKVVFLGPIYDRKVLSAWYCRSDLFLFPSSFDTNGLVVREAAACSLGSVLIDGSCAAEGVTAGRNGFLIEENAASLAVLLADEGRSKKAMHAVGQAAADELYISWPQAIDKAIERYHVVTDNYKSGRYPKKTTPVDNYLSFQGALMDIISTSRDLIDTYL